MTEKPDHLIDAVIRVVDRPDGGMEWYIWASSHDIERSGTVYSGFELRNEITQNIAAVLRRLVPA